MDGKYCLSNQFLCKKQSIAVFPVSVLCLPMKSATAPTSMEILLLLLLPQCSKVPFYGELVRLKNQIETHAFSPNIIYEGKAQRIRCVYIFHVQWFNYGRISFHLSEVLETFYAQKEVVTRIRQKSVDLRHIVQNALERTAKKYDLQLKQLKDTDKKKI